LFGEQLSVTVSIADESCGVPGQYPVVIGFASPHLKLAFWIGRSARVSALAARLPALAAIDPWLPPAIDDALRDAARRGLLAQ
jgi:hypothetical protein